MREVSATYKTLRTAIGSRYEVQVVLDDAVYDSSDLMSVVVHQSILSGETGPAVGGTVSNWCTVTLDDSSENWPRMAEFEIRARLVSADGRTVSEWLSFGTFYTDTREEDNGYLRITAYDAMLLLQQSWTDKIPAADRPENWPITAAAAAALLAETTGISLDPQDTLDNTVAFVGLNTLSTARDVWRDIAAAHGCNAVITTDGYIHLVPLTNTEATGSAIAGIAVAGIAVVGTSSSGGSAQDFVDLGHATRKLKTSPELPAVKQVELTNDAGGTASAGTGTGYVLKGSCNFSDSAAAQLCLTHVQNYVYRPFTASGADLDPVAEPGDPVLIAKKFYQIMRIDWDLGAWIYADLDAPVEYEIDHEYKIESEAAKYYRKALSASSEALTAFVENVYNPAIQDIGTELDGKVDTYFFGYVPTLSNEPASGWTTADAKDAHLDDIFYNTATGYAYRFTKSESTYSWTRIKDSDITAAMTAASQAKDTADGKRRVFTVQPKNADAYDVGDLWVNATYGTAYSNDLLRCKTQKAAGAAFSIAHWEKASRYTDDSALSNYYTKTETLSYIQQNAEDIVLGVTETRYYDKDTIDAQNQNLSGDITIEHDRITAALTEINTVDGEVEEIQSYIRYETISGVGTVIIGQTNSLSEFRVSNEQIAAVYNNEIVSYWNQSKQYTPKQLQIPAGGSLRLGNILWQPRSSGNLSLFLTNS